MSELYGTLRSNRTNRESTRCADHSLVSTAACWQGAIKTHLYHCKETGSTNFVVELTNWGNASNRTTQILASGLLDSEKVKVHAPACIAD